MSYYSKVRTSEIDEIKDIMSKAALRVEVLEGQNERLEGEVEHLRKQNLILTNRLCGKVIVTEI